MTRLADPIGPPALAAGSVLLASGHAVSGTFPAAGPAAEQPPATASAPAWPDPTPAELLSLARGLAAEPGLISRVPVAADERTWIALPVRPGLQAWLIAWPAGTGTGWHDHGDAKGAMVVVDGRLTERSTERPAGLDQDASLALPEQEARVRRFAAVEGRSFSARHVHEVTNEGSVTAYSVHVYHPDLTLMRRYVPSGGRLLPIGTESAGDW